MAHYTGPKARINRRLGAMVYESSGAVRAAERRDSPPGMHVRRGKLSTYGQALLEKQKLKHAYGLGERTLVRLFKESQRRPGNTGNALLELCELRLDNVVCRAGISKTRPQARQGVVHGHFLVNGRKVDKPSFRVRPGDVVTVKNQAAIVVLYGPIAENNDRVVPDWLRLLPDHLRVEVASKPPAGEAAIPIEISKVVELLSR